MKAQCELKAEGLPYPRTCPVCGLGACTRMVTVPRLSGDETLKAAAETLRSHLSGRIADLVTKGEMSAATALTEQAAWRFLGEIIGDVAPPTPSAESASAARGETP